MDKFLKNERWIKGPHFLTKPDEEWSKDKFEVQADDHLKIKKELCHINLEALSVVDELVSRSSCWIETLRRVAWVLKFVDWIKSLKNHVQPEEGQNRLSIGDLEKAKKRTVAVVQRKSFPAEMKSLEKGMHGQSSIPLIRLKPMIKDGVMRVGGRLLLAPISDDAKNPMLLPKDHHISTILIHGSNGHCGIEQVLCHLREQFWIVKARVAIKKVLSHCIHYRKQMAAKQNQEMACLPKVRLTPYEPPFTYTGVDYFGPFYVKRGRRRTMEKRWGAMFVCLNTRAVNLEVAVS